MKKVGIRNHNSEKAVKYLNKLLTAADTAQQQGKYLALDKVLKEAKRLSEHIRENQMNPFEGSGTINNKKAISELQWLKYQGAHKAPPFNGNQANTSQFEYKKVIGEIVN